jgi:hypothetical protein
VHGDRRACGEGEQGLNLESTRARAVVLPRRDPDQVLPWSDDLDASKTLQPSQVSIARNDIVCTGFDRAFEEHVIAGIVANDFNMLRWQNREGAV